MDLTQAILLTIATAATPLLIAAIGELVVERSGVLNLGVEGMMLMGAVSGFAAAQYTGSAWLGHAGCYLCRQSLFRHFCISDAHTCDQSGCDPV
jgi:ABC-type uncharacterized transport system permease subunit